jgi:hypothetical protein
MVVQGTRVRVLAYKTHALLLADTSDLVDQLCKPTRKQVGIDGDLVPPQQDTCSTRGECGTDGCVFSCMAPGGMYEFMSVRGCVCVGGWCMAG